MGRAENSWTFLLALGLGLGIVFAGAGLRAEGAYTLEESYAQAIKRSEVIATHTELITQAEEEYKQSVGAVLPTINGQVQYLRQPAPTGLFAQTFSPSDQTTVKLTATQPLFHGLRDMAMLNQKDHQRESQKYAKEQAMVELFTDVEEAFYNVLTLERDLANYQAEIGANDGRLRQAQQLRRSGRARRGDTLAIDAALANLQADLESIRAQLATAREVFAFQTGLNQTVKLVDTEPLPESLQGTEYYLSRLDSRPDIQSAKQELEASEAGVRNAFGGHLPSVDLIGDYFLTRPGYLENVNWDIQVVATIPLFSGGITQSQVREAVSQKTAKELSYLRAKRQAAEDIRSLHARVAGDLSQVSKIVRAVRLTEESYRTEWHDYRLGLATHVDILQASATALQTRRALDRAIFTAKADFARLQAAAAFRPALKGLKKP